MIQSINDGTRYAYSGVTAGSSVDEAPGVRLPLELVSSTLFLLSRLGHSVKSWAIDEFEKAGFSVYDYGVLAIVGQGTCAAQSTIADALRLDRSQLVGVLDSLEERGLVERRRDPDDRRRHTVTLTAKGDQELTKLRRLVHDIEQELLAPLDTADREALHGLLLTVASHHDARFVCEPAA
jgi:DNA-binding MarR family transcriptional regulator